jgi:Tetratricopeptide repeat
MKSASSKRPTFSPSLIFALAAISAFAPNLARAADASPMEPLAIYAIPVTAMNSATPTPPVVLAHLDEESLPSAENPGNSTAGPGENPGPSDDWKQVPAAAAPVPVINPTGGTSPSASPQGASPGLPALPPKGQPAGPSVTEPHPDNAIAPVSANGASAPAGGNLHPANLTTGPSSSAPAKSQPAPESNDASAADPNGSGTEALRDSGGNQGVSDANAGPPPALDLGSIQSGPDLAETPLDGEIKKADTPALMAALRVTEQARVELEAGQTADAIRDLGRAVSIDPGNPFEYFYLGRAYIARRNYTQALTFLQRAEIGFASRPDWLGADVGFEGNCYEELGQNSEAALAYQRALATAPNNVTARVGYSRLATSLPSPPTPATNEDATAEAAPVHEASDAPRDDAAEPAPSNDEAAEPAPPEPPPPPPPASNASADSGPKQSTAWDYPPD